MTQPLGHSSSGSHERYKSDERLEWESEHDPNIKFREWILKENLADEQTILSVESRAIERARLARELAWQSFSQIFNEEIGELKELISAIEEENREMVAERNR